MIKVEANPEAPPKNMKEARNRDKNWKLARIPDHAQTETLFKTLVTAGAHRKAGLLESWGTLGVVHVYPDKGYKVVEDNAWYQLVRYFFYIIISSY